MSSSFFNEGMPHGLIAPMYDDGYSIQSDLVDPAFAAELFRELKDNGKYEVGEAETGKWPGVEHDPYIVESLDEMPRLNEYWQALEDAITEVSGFKHPSKPHLTYLTVRACPVGEMSSQIHRNDRAAGPWLVSLVVAGSGSFNVYSSSVIRQGEEIQLYGDRDDPEPIASADMSIGDAWGIYSKEWSAPHAGGLNTSRHPKVLLLLYGWRVCDEYPHRNRPVN